MTGSMNVGFLVCPPESLLDGFVQRPDDLDPALVRAVSSHLSRCAPCRDEADRRRRGREAVTVRRPWPWAIASLACLTAAAAAILWHEPGTPAADAALRFTMNFTGGGAEARPDPRISALARFEPPEDAALRAGIGEDGPSRTALSPEDQRELAAARALIRSESWTDATRLLEDLTGRHAANPGLRLLLAYSFARAGEFERARWNYALADEIGAGISACLGLANASLKLGDVTLARRELADHVLSRRPDAESARELLDRINATSRRPSR